MKVTEHTSITVKEGWRICKANAETIVREIFDEESSVERLRLFEYLRDNAVEYLDTIGVSSCCDDSRLVEHVVVLNIQRSIIKAKLKLKGIKRTES